MKRRALVAVGSYCFLVHAVWGILGLREFFSGRGVDQGWSRDLGTSSTIQ